MYKGIVEPHFNYCCSVWGSCGTTRLNKLQKLQNRAARIVTDSDFDASTAPLIQDLGWPTIEQLIHRETSTMAYKCLNQLAPAYLIVVAFLNCQFPIHELFGTLGLTYVYLKRELLTDRNVSLIVEPKFGMILIQKRSWHPIFNVSNRG